VLKHVPGIDILHVAYRAGSVTVRDERLGSELTRRTSAADDRCNGAKKTATTEAQPNWLENRVH